MFDMNLFPYSSIYYVYYKLAWRDMNTTFTSWLLLKISALSDGIYTLFQHVSKQNYMQTETGIAPDRRDHLIGAKSQK